MYFHNRIKKLIVTSLILLLLYHSGGFILLYTPTSFLIKKITKELIRTELINSPLVKFSFSVKELENGIDGLVWLHDKEFRYDQNMYDVVRKEIIGDKVVFVCFADTKEDLLENSFQVHFQNGKETKSLDSNSQRLNLQSLSEVITQPLNCCPALFEVEILTTSLNESVLSLYSNVLTPPPEQTFS